MSYELPRLGVGLGYRSILKEDIIGHRDKIDFLEVITDQYIYATPEKVDQFMGIAEGFPLVPHGVSLSVGTDMPVDEDYVQRTADFVKRADAP
jgi:uncharacterized protein (UPF0276 family)